MHVQADSEHDYGISIQGKAIYQLAMEHLKKAFKPELIKTGFYQSYPTYAKDCTENTRALSYNIPTRLYKNYLGTFVVCAFSDTFMKKNNYKKFFIAVAFYDSTKNKRINTWNGFFTQQGFGNYPGITLYCPVDTDAGYFDFDRREDLVSKFKTAINVESSKLKSLFVHEFTHNYNYLQFLDRAEKTNQARAKKGLQPKPAVPSVKYKSPPETWTEPGAEKKYSDYINDPQEINARYMEWIHAVQISFIRLLRVKQEDYDIRRAFKTFADFWEFYWETPGFVPPELYKYATQKTKKRLARRFYGYYRFLCDNPGVNANEAENFARDLMRLDFNQKNSYWMDNVDVNAPDYLA